MRHRQRDDRHRNLRVKKGWDIPGKEAAHIGWRMVSEQERGVSGGCRAKQVMQGCLGPGEEVRFSSETKGK